jgi:ABC-type Na+ efflux pump permease subunit
VLCGPQGIPFGKNASAGLMSITTSLSIAEAGGSLRATYTTGNEVNAVASEIGSDPNVGVLSG